MGFSKISIVHVLEFYLILTGDSDNNGRMAQKYWMLCQHLLENKKGLHTKHFT